MRNVSSQQSRDGDPVRDVGNRGRENHRHNNPNWAGRVSPSEPTGAEIFSEISERFPETVTSKGNFKRQLQPIASPDVSPEFSAKPKRKFVGLQLRRGDQFFVAILVVATLLLMLVHWFQLSGWGLQPLKIERREALQYDYQIEINSASWVEWAQLAGIGQVLARRIVSDREEYGPFSGVDDIERVKGIGPKTLAKLRPWLMTETEPTSD